MKKKRFKFSQISLKGIAAKFYTLSHRDSMHHKIANAFIDPLQLEQLLQETVR